MVLSSTVRQSVGQWPYQRCVRISIRPFVPLMCLPCKLGDNQLIVTAPGSPPREVQARPISSNTVVVQWNEPEFPNGVVRVRQHIFSLNIVVHVLILSTETL